MHLRHGLLAVCLVSILVAMWGSLGAPAIADGVTVVLYNDHDGIPPQDSVYVWADTISTPGDHWNGRFIGGCPADPAVCFETISTGYAGWGVFRLEPFDATPCQALEFWAKTPCDLRVEVENRDHVKDYVLLSELGWTQEQGEQWLSFAIGTELLADVDLSDVFGAFMVTATSDCTFYIDAVRWTGCTPIRVNPTHWGTIKTIWR